MGINKSGEKMKKFLRIALTICLSFFYVILLFGCEQKSEMRLRILASSNSEEDQKIKLEVKEIVYNYLKTNNKLNGNNIEIGDLESYLNQQFENNDIKVTHEKVKYEAKAYEGKIIQAGYYDTILITIDEGKGKNFWTLLYPEFFDISFDGENEIEYHSYFYDLFHN